MSRPPAADAAYEVFARRYRPAGFDEVVGQEHVGQTLKNAIKEGRVGHAYLFAGPRGVGKTSTARIFARALNCVKGPTPDPCGECELCLHVHDGTDADVIEMDAASNRSVDDARALRDGVRYAPLRARSKIYIIDEAHMLTREAFNTLLKTLEEPPPHVKFIFATTEIQKLPDTIVSRCQRFDFRRITAADLAKRLTQIVKREKLDVPDDVVAAVARAGRGSMRDAESVLDQLVAFKPKGLTGADVARLLGMTGEDRMGTLIQAVRDGNSAGVLGTLDAIFADGIDAGAFTDQLIEHFRLLMVVRVCGKDSPVVDLPDAMLAGVDRQAALFSVEALLYALQLLLEARRRVKEGIPPRLVLEITLVKMSKIGDLISLGEALKGGAVAAPVAPAKAPVRPSAADERPPVAALAEVTAEAPAPEKPVPSGPPADLDQLAAVWPKVVAEVKAKNVLAGALLQTGRPSKLAGDEIEFTLGPNMNRFHIDQLEQAKNRTVVESVFHALFGRRYGFHVALEAGRPGPGGSAPAFQRSAPTGDLSNDPKVRKVLEAFPGSKIVGIE